MLIHEHLPLTRISMHLMLVAVEPCQDAGSFGFLDTNYGFGLVTSLTRDNFTKSDGVLEHLVVDFQVLLF